MNKLSKPTHDYIAFDPTCGCVVGLIADIPGKDTAKDVAKFIKAGYNVERVSRDSDRFKLACENFGHKCEKDKPEQIRMLL